VGRGGPGSLVSVPPEGRQLLHAWVYTRCHEWKREVATRGNGFRVLNERPLALGWRRPAYRRRKSCSRNWATLLSALALVLMQRASGANAATPAPPRSSRLKKYHLWAFTRTQLAHRCWRLFHGLVIHLPHVLLGGFKVGTLMSLGAVGLQHKSAGRCRLCCVHKGLQRFCQPSICCWNGPRQSAAIFNKMCWVQNLWAMRENIRKRPYAMGHGH
jgi:hypothetical protein